MSEISPQTRPIQRANRRALEVELRSFAVRVEEGPDEGLEVLLEGASLCAGTDRGCELVLSDPTVSRRHVLFKSTEQGVVAEDLDSSNGTWLGSASIKSAMVADGALLTLGGTKLRVKIAPRKLVVFPGKGDRFCGLIGAAPPMRDLYALLQQVARTDLPVLVTGETGSGKELVARAIHESSPRKAAPLIVLDCGSLVPDLLRSELFGHEKGAFTGAEKATAGVLEEAAGGTVFLDEIGEMDLSIQPHLLRALENREITRLGSRKPLKVDFRIVAATNRDLGAMARAGKFRPDLYYRLAGMTLCIPPLRDRREDVAPIARELLARFCERNRLPALTLEAGALEQLAAHAWPGNVRELKHVIERLATQAAGETIERAAVASALAAGGPASEVTAAPAGGAMSLDAAEATAIRKALAATGGRKSAAAKVLGISRSALYEKLARYGIGDPEPR